MDKKIESAQGEQTNTSSNAHQEINHGITDQIVWKNYINKVKNI